jgi:ATP-dependent exoDNAse (exonuclease V) beta subunit
MRNPSSWADAQDAAERRRLVQSYRESVQVVAGSTAAPDLPWPEGAVLNERTQGDVVHGWLERWGLRDAPDPADARRYLEDRWRCDDDALAHGLCALGTHLLDALPGLRSLIEGAASLRFEVPILARVGGDALVGRADLVVEHGDGSVTVIDFKAGTHTAQILPNDEIDDDEADRSVRVPGLSRYAWQLEAYRRALTSAGRQVREVGLVYVRGPSWARWCS